MNNQTIAPENYKYVAYIRKSEEREERQQLSHGAQLDKARQQFPDAKIIDPDHYIESKSAFKPDNRPLFAEMIEQIKAGKIQGIIAYHPNRLARNELDAAQITYLLRTGIIKDLKFCTYTFENTPEGIMMLQIHLSQGQYESSKQSREVARGMEAKAKLGERPGRVPIGYMKVPIRDQFGNLMRDKDGDFITATQSDPERLPLVQKMWKLMLTGTYTAPQIRKIANEQWKFTVRPTAKTGGGPMGISSIYRLFSNPFYAGFIRHNGQLHQTNNHKAIITLQEFDHVQRVLGAKGKPRVNINEYAYTGLIQCGTCGCQIVGKTNQKYVKREGKVVTYVHYRCTRRSLQRPCDENKYTSLEALENEIATELQKYTILPEFRDLALDILKRDNALEVQDRTSIYKSQQKRREQIQTDIDGLVDMKLHGQLDETEYTVKRTKLKEELAEIDGDLRGTEVRADDWMELTERAFNFAVYASTHFRETTDLHVKREILMTLGANLTLSNQKLSLEAHKWLVPLNEEYPALEAEYLRARTKEKPLVSQNVGVNDNWRAIWDSNPGHGD